MNTLRPILIIGANGLIGQSIIHHVSQDRPCIGTTFSRTSASFITLNVLDQSQIKEILIRLDPSIVIHCANFPGGAKACEENPERGRKFYFETTEHLVDVCQKIKSRLIFFSTECVFDGNKERYVEEDEPSPLNHYGEFKAKSEKFILNNLIDSLIIRTTFVFGWQPETQTPNALMSTYFNMKSRKPTLAPTYRWGQPTYVQDLGKAIRELVKKNKIGVYHLAGNSYLNRFEWLKRCAEKLDWDQSLIIPESNNVQSIKYPSRVFLDTSKFHSQCQFRFNDLDSALSLIKIEINPRT